MSQSKLAYEKWEAKKRKFGMIPTKQDAAVAKDAKKDIHREQLESMMNQMLNDIKEFSHEHRTIKSILAQLKEFGTISEAQSKYCTQLYLEAFEKKLMKVK
jgi:hypothetical protein